MSETTLISKCCEAETWELSGGIGRRCLRCKKVCATEEVCAYCLGTGEVSTDVDDGEGHMMHGVGTEKCICQVEQE